MAQDEVERQSREGILSFTEIPLSSNLEYELDKPCGLTRIDPILHSAVSLANYSFIPKLVNTILIF